jgi:DNA-binding IclR family transcriptional regulator
MQRDAVASTRHQRGIQSIELGGAILKALVDHGGSMMLRDLAAAAGMSAAKAHPYLVSFGKLGLIEQDPTTGRYGLGAAALQMGLAALRSTQALRLATPEAARLAEAIQLNIAIAVWGNHGPTVVSIEECSRPVHVNMRPGTVMSLRHSATGRIFAAYLPAGLTQTLLQAEDQVIDEAITSSERNVEESLADVRQRGLARALGKPIPGISGFSAPVFDHNGHLVLTITAMGPTTQFDPRWNGRVAQPLRHCAKSLSERLGWTGAAQHNE